jgi:hypothetical protein
MTTQEVVTAISPATIWEFYKKQAHADMYGGSSTGGYITDTGSGFSAYSRKGGRRGCSLSGGNVTGGNVTGGMKRSYDTIVSPEMKVEHFINATRTPGQVSFPVLLDRSAAANPEQNPYLYPFATSFNDTAREDAEARNRHFTLWKAATMSLYK